MASEDAEAVSSLIIGIFRSPTWILPISQFVDENCGIFEDVEENKLEYTLVHNAFRKLVEDLLTIHTVEMGITTEQFTTFCQHGLSGDNSSVQRCLVEQLISVDDFLVFKAMMLKRNAETSLEVVKVDPSQPEESEAERLERLELEQRIIEAELQLALALSRQLEKRLQLIEALNEILETAAALTIQAQGTDQEAEAEAACRAALDLQEKYGLSSTLQLQPLLDSQGGFAAEPSETQKAEAAAQQEQAMTKVTARQNAPAARDPGQPTEEERQARAEHLRNRRAALVEKKNREREAQLNAFQEVNGITASLKMAERACANAGHVLTEGGPGSPQAEAGKNLLAELRGAQEPSAAGTPLEDPEAAALEMRRAIAKQLKQTLTQSLQ
eukprot:TRINITY_DN22088_c0_g1_i2.p1 TRINITY_DN22088_c0_g1~~TRINITY_DN22088_c0_g1_i2.p1  ORF type:complete len:417 (-),score=88.05 TRINITY_DN22088_c0_g1_i2:60-1214(-)